jgi:tRNA(fMet)-specific endonuclease VapC
MMKYMLDTDICSYIIDYKSERLNDVVEQHGKDQLCISVMTYSELMFGARKRDSKKLFAHIFDFLPMVRIIDFTKAAGDEYAKIRRDLEAKGHPIGTMDMLIAASAKAEKAILVSNNGRHFQAISGLTVENWLSPPSPLR